MIVYFFFDIVINTNETRSIRRRSTQPPPRATAVYTAAAPPHQLRERGGVRGGEIIGETRWGGGPNTQTSHTSRHRLACKRSGRTPPQHRRRAEPESEGPTPDKGFFFFQYQGMSGPVPPKPPANPTPTPGVRRRPLRHAARGGAHGSKEGGEMRVAGAAL